MRLEDRLPCTNCKGTGKIGRSTKITQGSDLIYFAQGYRAVLEQVDCTICKGTGYIPKPTTSEYSHLK